MPPAPQTSSSSNSSTNLLTTLPPFQISFSIKLTCEACITSVRRALLSLPGIISVDLSLAGQTVTTFGNAPPSSILKAIQSTGRDAVVRGTGSGSGSGEGMSVTTGAAVAILEDYEGYDDPDWIPPVGERNQVRGLARIVQVSRADDGSAATATRQALSVVDISLSGMEPGLYQASIRVSGDISQGSRSVGKAWREVGELIEVGVNGMGSAVVVGQGWEVWEIVGRAFAVERVQGGDDKQMVLGVVARSAGVWDNEKMVCSCSGKTVWEERVEQKGRGML